MENQVISGSEEKTPEQIEAEMLATRESLTEKVAALENQVVETVQTAAHTLTETVDAVKSFVETAPEAVSETVENVASAVKDRVRRTFDISDRVEDAPWASMGVSVGLGFIAGYLFSSDDHSRVSGHRMAVESAAPMHPHPFSSSEPDTRTGFFDEVMAIVSRKLKGVAESAIETASASLEKTVRDTIPKLMNEASNWVAAEARPTTNGRHFDEHEHAYEG